MSESNGAADAATATATPAQSTEQGAENSQAQQSDDGAWRNPQEIKKYFQRTQRLEDGIAEIKSLLQSGRSEQTKVKADKPANEVEALRAELAFKDLVADAAGHLTRAQREALSQLHSMERPGNSEQWVAQKVAAMGWSREATAKPNEGQKTATPEKASHVTNTGAPGSSGGPANLADAVKDAKVYMSLSPADRKKAWDAYKATDPTTGRVFNRNR